MTITPQTYTAAATWTASGLADIFKSAFIDAGLMSDWFDSFLSGTIENRILRVINNAGKTYGTVYYWFMFTTTGVSVQTTGTWNATTHVPTGTQYLDYFSTTTNATTNHRALVTLDAVTTCTITRYTSGVNNAVTWFLIANGSTYKAFMLSHPSFNASSFVDQDKVLYNGFLDLSSSANGNYVTIDVRQLTSFRRSYLGAVNFRSLTSSSYYASAYAVNSFSVMGNASNSAGNSPGSSTVSTWLPVAATNTQAGLAANHFPVFAAPSISPYMSALPNDFGFIPYFASNAMIAQDTIVVNAGTEEWQIIHAANNAATDASRLLFCARTI